MRKPKTCRICHEKYIPFNTIQATCLNPKCILAYQRKLDEKRDKQERKRNREAKHKLKTRSDWLKEAQREFNKYIRLRDSNQNCISCGRNPKKRNAGHYRSVGACPELRFEETNCHIQCEHCNSYKSGNIVEYRSHLIEKIGLERVEWLEGKHEPKKYTIDDIKEIKQIYRNKCKELEG